MKIGKYIYEKSTRSDKKLMTIVNNKKVHFGSSAMDHFKDKTGIWKSKDHNDAERRTSYLARSAGIKDGQGKLTKDDPTSPNYHSRRILW